MKIRVSNLWKDYGTENNIEMRFDLFSISWICGCELIITLLNFEIYMYFPKLYKRGIEKIKDADIRFKMRQFDFDEENNENE